MPCIGGGELRTAHWSHAWLGRAWEPGRYECGDFAADVLRSRFGVRVALPRGRGVRERDALAARLAGAVARPLAPGEAPREGDGVLMRAAGRRAAIGHHVGLWCAPADRACVLHCMAGHGARLDALRDLPLRGLELAGIYRWTALEKEWEK